MTWPFENDTSAIVKKLADRSMKADKRRNAFIIITIAFAVSLMMVLALYNLGTDRENRLYLQGRYQSSFINSTSAVFEKLEHNNQIEAVGKEAAMGTSRINDYTLDVYYRDQNALELKGVTDLLGKMPEAENEIIVELYINPRESMTFKQAFLQIIPSAYRSLYKLWEKGHKQCISERILLCICNTAIHINHISGRLECIK